jgi:formate dehydrogenase gamma subunit
VDSPKAPESRLNRTNLPKLCGSCHKEVYSVYLGSVHGKSWQKGNTDSALCSDCHGEHAVLEHTQAKAPAGAKNIPATCSRCHASEKLAGRYPLSARKYVSYMDSFHGVALAYGDVTVANCASCHGYHEILPSSNLASMTHKSNIVKTCGRCHPGAGENFAKGAIHMEGSPTSDPIVFYVRMFYTLIIGAMTFGFVTMIGLDLYRRYHVVSPKSLGLLLFRMLGLGRRREESAAKSEGSVRTFERLTLNERLQHGTLIVSFMLLVVTGLPLFFYHFKLFHALIPGETLFQLRGAMHRVAAVILIVLSVWHALYILFTHRGHREFLEFLPRWRDITDFIDLVKYSIGKVPSPPRFGKYNIYHKFEYWAVVWGTTVMIATGFLLWFEVESAIFFPKWLLDIARVVHGYEATLAFLAIIIWHFYNVHFNPEVFPLSQLWITGKLTEEEMKMYHPLEYEEIIEEEHLRALEKERLAAASNPLPDKEKT